MSHWECWQMLNNFWGVQSRVVGMVFTICLCHPPQPIPRHHHEVTEHMDRKIHRGSPSPLWTPPLAWNHLLNAYDVQDTAFNNCIVVFFNRGSSYSIGYRCQSPGYRWLLSMLLLQRRNGSLNVNTTHYLFSLWIVEFGNQCNLVLNSEVSLRLR